MFRYLCLPFLILSGSSAFGDLLIDVASAPVLEWNDPTIDPSPVIQLRLDNPANITDAIVGMTLSAQVTGQPGAVGSVEIDDIASSDFLIFTAPTGPSATKQGEVLIFPPLNVPPGGADLANMTFTASSDASGLFDVELLPYIPPDVGTFWTNDSFQPVAFDNTQATLLIGTVSVGAVTVPEPSSLAAWALLSILALRYVRLQ